MIEYEGYQIKPHKDSPMLLQVVTAGKGGKAPDCLTGMFTSVVIAKQAIDSYRISKSAKEVKHDKEGKPSGDK